MNLVCGGLVSIMDRFVGVKQNILFVQFDWNMNKKMMDLPYADVESYAVQEQREKIKQMQQVNGMGLWKLVLSIKTAIRSIFSILYAVAAFYSVFFYQGEGMEVPWLDFSVPHGRQFCWQCWWS